VFIDDTAENVAAAQRLGMDGILFRSTEQTIEELEASSALRGYQSTRNFST